MPIKSLTFLHNILRRHGGRHAVLVKDKVAEFTVFTVVSYFIHSCSRGLTEQLLLSKRFTRKNPVQRKPDLAIHSKENLHCK